MHVMIDIETLSTHPTAAFFEIAAVPFDLAPSEEDEGVGPINIPAPLHLHIDPSNQIESGKFHVDWNTLKWWKTEPRSWEGYDRIPTLLALQKLANEYRWNVIEGIWSKGPAFDVAILEHAYYAYNLKAPWSHRSVWDVRTILKLAGTDNPTTPSHDALADAQQQVAAVQEARRILIGQN